MARSGAGSALAPGSSISRWTAVKPRRRSILDDGPASDVALGCGRRMRAPGSPPSPPRRTRCALEIVPAPRPDASLRHGRGEPPLQGRPRDAEGPPGCLSDRRGQLERPCQRRSHDGAPGPCRPRNRSGRALWWGVRGIGRGILEVIQEGDVARSMNSLGPVTAFDRGHLSGSRRTAVRADRLSSSPPTGPRRTAVRTRQIP